MMGLRMVLKSLGVNFTDEHVAQIEAMIPQIPRILTDSVKTVNNHLDRMDVRQKGVENAVELLGIKIDAMNQTISNQSTEISALIEQVANLKENIHAFRSGELRSLEYGPNGAVAGSSGGSIASAGTRHGTNRRSGTKSD